MSLPPYARLLGLSIEADEDGAPLLVMPFDEDVVGRPGFLHGGAIAGLLEMAALAGARRALGGSGDRDVELVAMTVDYRRGGRALPTRAIGVVTRAGTRVVNVDAVAWQDDRAAPIATARATCRVARR